MFWRKVLLVIKVILRYGHLKVFWTRKKAALNHFFPICKTRTNVHACCLQRVLHLRKNKFRLVWGRRHVLFCMQSLIAAVWEVVCGRPRLHAVCGKECTLYIILQELYSLGATWATNSHAALSPSLTGQLPSPSLVQPSLWVSHASHLAAAPAAAAAMVNIVPSLTTFF